MSGCGHGVAMPPPPEQDGPCCWSAVHSDMEHCDCWQPIVWPPVQREARQEGPQSVRPGMCGDCAYRPDSPERVAAGGDRLPNGIEQPFQCHDEMPKVTGYVHPPTGATMRPEGDDYKPDQAAPGRSFRSDGRPALLCAGWAANVGAKRPRRPAGATGASHG